MSAQPGEGTEVPQDIDLHTTAGKLADLDRRLAGDGRRSRAHPLRADQ